MFPKFLTLNSLLPCHSVNFALIAQLSTEDLPELDLRIAKLEVAKVDAKPKHFAIATNLVVAHLTKEGSHNHFYEFSQ